jgi:hypothetical protein
VRTSPSLNIALIDSARCLCDCCSTLTAQSLAALTCTEHSIGRVIPVSDSQLTTRTRLLLRLQQCCSIHGLAATMVSVVLLQQLAPSVQQIDQAHTAIAGVTEHSVLATAILHFTRCTHSMYVRTCKRVHCSHTAVLVSALLQAAHSARSTADCLSHAVSVMK